jgi:hypothetical protein
VCVCVCVCVLVCLVGGGDKDAGCGFWKTLGFCEPTKGYLDFMEDTCQVTCGFCEGKILSIHRKGLKMNAQFRNIRQRITLD